MIYGSRTLGGSTDVLLHGAVTVTEGADDATLSCQFVITAATEAAFGTLVRAIETDLRTPRQRLRLVFGDETHIDWNPADGSKSAFHQQPSLDIVGDRRFDSGRSRLYRFTCRTELPANLYSQDGRRDSTATIKWTPSRRETLIVSGEYRADTTDNSAYDQYVDGIGAYVTSLLSRYSLTGLVELAEEEATSDDIDAIVTFTRRYERIFQDQAPGLLDDASLVEQTMVAQVSKRWPEDSTVETAHPITLAVRYSAWVRDTSDLPGLWTGTVRGHLLDVLKAQYLDGGDPDVVASEVEYDLQERRIIATLRLEVWPGPLVTYSRNESFQDHEGNILEPLWVAPLSRHHFVGPRTITCIVTETWKQTGSHTDIPKEPKGLKFAPVEPLAIPPWITLPKEEGTGVWIRMQVGTPTSRKVYMGEDNKLEGWEYQRAASFEFAVTEGAGDPEELPAAPPITSGGTLAGPAADL